MKVLVDKPLPKPPAVTKPGAVIICVEWLNLSKRWLKQ